MSNNITRRRMLKLMLTSAALPAVLPDNWAGAVAPAQTAAPAAAAPLAASDDILATLRTARPRLFFKPGQVAALKQQIVSNADIKAIHDGMTANVPKLLAEPRPDPNKYNSQTPGDPNNVRRNMQRIAALAGAWMLDGNTQARDRAKQDALDIAAWPTWGTTGEFLNIGSTLIAVALAYDWMFDQYTPAERQTMRTAIVEKGLKVGLQAYNQNPLPSYSWVETHGNWGQVCNGGIGVGALAVADDEPALARDILAKLRTHIQAVMGAYNPDGGFHENVTYNAYGLEYNIYLIEALRSALGDDWGLPALPGFDKNPLWRMYMIGPLDKVFNFGDQNEGPAGTDQALWIAQQFNRRLYRDYEISRGSSGRMGGIFGLIFTEPSHAWGAAQPMPATGAVFHGIDVATLRSAWNDPNAFFVGLKGGDNHASHAHLDLGSVVFDALGQRWSIDPGQMDYSLPGSFNTWAQTGTGGLRWSYYRARTEGHNTLAISAQTQPPLAFANQWRLGTAPIIAFQSAAARSFAVIDLTKAYVGTDAGKTFDARQVTDAKRGVALLDGNKLLIQDEVKAAANVEVIWQWHTRAAVTISGNVATLTQGGKTMKAKILSPAGASFQLITATPQAPDNTTQDNGKNLIIRANAGPAGARIAVVFAPDADTLSLPALTPLSTWIASTPTPGSLKTFVPVAAR